MTKLRKEAREKGLMDQSPVEPAATIKKGGRKVASGSQKSAKGGSSETQVESDESETGVVIKMEGKLSDEEESKFDMKKNVKKSTKAQADKTIAGRVAKPRAKNSALKQNSGKGKESAVDSIENDGDTQGMTPESMPSDNGHSAVTNVETVEI